MKRLAALCLCLLMAALAACGVGEAPVSGSSPAAEGASPSPAAQRRVMVRFDPVSETVTGDDGAVLLSYGYPRVTVTVSGSDAGLGISSEINAALTPQQEELDRLAQAAAAEYAALDGGGRESWTGYGLYYSAAVMRGDSRLLSLSCSVSEQSGGAYPNNSGFGLSFNLDGGRISAESLDSGSGRLESEAERSVLAAISSGEDADSYFGADGFVESALAGGQWYFSDGGLTLFANEGEIAPRAVGQVVFTLPYEDIAGCLAEEYAPVAASAPGSAGALKISPGAGGCEFSAVLDEGGVEFRLSASQSVGSICVNRVSMDGSGGWFPTGQALYLSALGGGESLGLTAAFMDSPLYSLSYGAGCVYLIADSGRDGSLLLLDP